MDYTQKQAVIVRASQKLVDDLLKTNTNNRNIKKGHREWLEKAIENQEFVLTSQGIGIAKDGTLVDGQHRLAAIKAAGYPPVELLVVTGLDPKAMIYIDQHSKRTTADMLRIHLDKGITHRMAAIINSHLKLSEKDGEFAWSREVKPSLQAVVETMEAYFDKLDLLISAGGNVPRAGTYLALFHYMLKSGDEAALELAAQINSGENLLRNDPAYKIREKLMAGTKRGGYGSAGQLADYQLAVTACIAHSNGVKIDVLRGSVSWDGLKWKIDRIAGAKAKSAA